MSLQKKEVCRYWLDSRCLKGQQCEFLHALDDDRMPVCVLGDQCDNSDCKFKHPDPNRQECANYQLGFCSFGRRCQHKHVERRPYELPILSAYWNESYLATKRIADLKSSKTFRKKPCDYFIANKWCPYFDMCNFSH